MPNPRIRLSMNTPPELYDEIQARCRGVEAEAIRTGLARYYELLAHSRRDALRPVLTDAELAVLVGLEWRGTIDEVAQADKAWLKEQGVDQKKLLNKLGVLRTVDVVALLDALERHRDGAMTGIAADPSSLLT